MLKKNPILFSFLIVLGLMIATTFIRFQSVILDAPISFVAFFIASLLLIRKFRNNETKVFTGLTLSLTEIYLFTIFIDQSLPTLGLPNLILQYLAIFCAYFYAQKCQSLVLRIILPLGIFAFSLWYAIDGNKYWWQYMIYENVSGKENKPLETDWFITSENKDSIWSEDFKDKIVLLDFWQTTYGICYKKMPQLEKLYQKYSSQGIIILAVNIPIKKDSENSAFQLKPIKPLTKYTFPKWTGNAAIESVLEITSYPTVIILKNNIVVFKGTIELAEDALEKLTE